MTNLSVQNNDDNDKNNSNNNNDNSHNIKLKIQSHYKNMHIYCKKWKKHAGNTYPKKIILISKNKIKGKSRCAICLTERSFIYEIKYDLESELQIYLQFFTDWYYKNEDLLLEV